MGRNGDSRVAILVDSGSIKAALFELAAQRIMLQAVSQGSEPHA
jgi:hypothetical protein